MRCCCLRLNFKDFSIKICSPVDCSAAIFRLFPPQIVDDALRGLVRACPHLILLSGRVSLWKNREKGTGETQPGCRHPSSLSLAQMLTARLSTRHTAGLGHRVVLRSDVEEYKAGHVAVISGGGVFSLLTATCHCALQKTRSLQTTVPVMTVAGSTVDLHLLISL